MSLLLSLGCPRDCVANNNPKSKSRKIMSPAFLKLFCRTPLDPGELSRHSGAPLFTPAVSHHAVLQGGQGGGGPPPHSSPPTPGGGSTPVGGQAPTPPVVYHQPPGQGGAGGGPQGSGGGPQPPLVLVPHSGGANTPPHLMPHSPMVPPQLATAHFVHHQGESLCPSSCNAPPLPLPPPLVHAGNALLGRVWRRVLPGFGSGQGRKPFRYRVA